MPKKVKKKRKKAVKRARPKPKPKPKVNETPPPVRSETLSAEQPPNVDLSESVVFGPGEPPPVTRNRAEDAP